MSNYQLNTIPTTIPTTLSTFSTGIPSHPYYQIAESTESYTYPTGYVDQFKKGGRGGGSGGGRGSGSGSGRGSGDGDGEGSGSGSGGSSGNGRGSGSGRGSGNGGRNYMYRGTDYKYGYPVYYYGNGFYPRGIIMPVAWGYGGYLVAGHIYHTYTSSDTLYYSEMPSTCQGSSASTIYSSGSAVETCIQAGNSITFTDGGGLVTVQAKDLVSAVYSTLSDATDSSSYSSSSHLSTAAESSSDFSSVSVSSISATSTNGGGSLIFQNYPGKYQNLVTIFYIFVMTGSILTLM